MKVAVPKEIAAGELRVALVPESVKKMVKAGIAVAVESGAGAASFLPDAEYKDAGAEIISDAAGLFAQGDFVLKVQPPTAGAGGRHEADLMREGAMLLGSLYPTRHVEIMRKLAARRVTAFSTDCIPRTTRAQAMDTLSSMANIAGYKGVLLAAEALPRYLPMFMTAAGTTFAAKVFVIGAGVAGLQAIATAKRLGAQVTATDVRPEVKEQIQSVGAKYIGIELAQSASAGGGYAAELSEEDKKRQRELLVEHCGTVDVIVTTALIGGVFAPKIITADMVRKMRPSTVIVDLAAEGGGNCELTKPGQTVVENGVTILAPLNLPSTVPQHASVLFSRNLTHFVLAFWKDGKFNLDLSDEILKGAVITHNGEIVHAKTKEAAGRAP
ncbi:MAG: Re/Si-specific NAD(P)(+) transhydrogenase subunit alpha [Phycisphaerales bacterium]|nr:Re/Si-specific NAD(P)(+) transhydrogenase subunit alpha [Phycisphaerales bacterium]